MSPILAARITQDRVEEFLRLGFKFLILDEEGSTVWQNPEGSTVKINCDGSWLPDVKRAGFGCIAFDSDNVVLLVRSYFQDGLTSSLEGEGSAFLLALRWVVMEGCDTCIFETDNVVVYNCLY